MPRSLWKGPFSDHGVKKLWERVALKFGQYSQKTPIRVWSRRSTILPSYCGYKFEVHNGKQFIGLKVLDTMVGHKFGEFSLTRSYPNHPEKTAVVSLGKKKNPITGKGK